MAGGKKEKDMVGESKILQTVKFMKDSGFKAT